MQTDTVGSFDSSEMIICIHNDNLLIPRHLKRSHDFKKHFNNLSISVGPFFVVVVVRENTFNLSLKELRGKFGLTNCHKDSTR